MRIYETDSGKLLHKLEGQHGAVYAVGFTTSGKVVASAGFDGMVRLNDAETGKLIKEFSPVPVGALKVAAAGRITLVHDRMRSIAEPKHTCDRKFAMKRYLLVIGCLGCAALLMLALARRPKLPRRRSGCPRARRSPRSKLIRRRSRSTGKYAYAQVLLTAQLESGDRVDVTRMVEPAVSRTIWPTFRRRCVVRPKPTARAKSRLPSADNRSPCR